VIKLRKCAVHEFSTDVAGALDDGYVVRRGQNDWDGTNMITKFLGLQPIDLDQLLFAALQVASDFQVLVVVKEAVQGEEGRLMSNVQTVYPRESALCKRQVVNAVQEVRFAHAVETDEAIEARMEFESLIFIVLKMLEFEIRYSHRIFIGLRCPIARYFSQPLDRVETSYKRAFQYFERPPN